MCISTAASATSEDHDIMNSTIIITKCSRRECIDIAVTDDMSLEHHETFSLYLFPLPGHDDRILLDGVEKIVTITDTNRKTSYLHLIHS